MSDGQLTLTPEEFEQLKPKKQLTILYRHLVAERDETASALRKLTTMRWYLRGLILSDAALWLVMWFVLTRTV